MSTATTPAASPHHAAMFQYSHVFVRLHTRLQDEDHVVIMTVDPAGDAILITVTSRSCKSYEARLTANDMKELKDGVHATVEVPWNAFFDLIQKSFVDRNMVFNATTMKLTMTLKHERPELLSCPSFTTTMDVQMQLASPQDGVVARNVANMLAFLSLRSGDRKEAEKIDELIKKDDQLREDAALVTAEAAMLREGLQQFKRQSSAAEKQNAELQKLLRASSVPEVAEGWTAAMAAANLKRITSRVPTSWIEKPNAPRPTKLLKAIKVKWPFTISVTKGLPAANSSIPEAGADTQSNATSTSGMDDPFAASTRKSGIRGEHLRYCDVVPADSESSMPTLNKDEDDVFIELCRMDEWNFDVQDFETLCRKVNKHTGALFFLGYAAFMRLGLCARFNIAESTVLEWLSAVEVGYRNAPFHNSMHAADALHTVYFTFAQTEMLKRVKATDSQVLAAVIAAILIDFDHPGNGITNGYLRAAPPCYASVAYGGQSILENHHVASGFELMKLPRFNILDCVPSSARAELQTLTAQLVVATDLSRHDAFINACNKAAQANDFGSQKDDALLLITLVVKAADVAYAAKPDRIYSFWVNRLVKELAELGKLEEAIGLPPAAMTGLPSSAGAEAKVSMQLNFINYIVSPTFAALAELVPKMRLTGEHIKVNKAFWAQA